MLRLVALLVVAGVACVAYGIAIERSWYRLRRYDLAILPPGGPQRLAVLHLSDLHFVRTDPKKARFLASLPTADITVITGDFLAEPAAVETAVAAVRTARGSFASWFVLGSNDHFEPKPLNYFAYFRKRRTRRRALRGRADELIRGLLSDGWTDLTNVRALVDVNGLPIELLGLDDAHLRWHDLRLAPRRAPDRLATWRSLVARSVRDAEVAGSNPAVPTRGPGAGRLRRPAPPVPLTGNLFLAQPFDAPTASGLGSGRSEGSVR